MVQLCFVLDVRNLPPPLLTDLKQSLLQLANLYAISSPSSSSPRKCGSLRDRIGLCYVFKDRFSSTDELKIAYSPRESFELRAFHHAVDNLPIDAFLPDSRNHSDLIISSVLNDRVLYSWEGKDIERKVIVLTSCVPEDVDSIVQKIMMDAADKCVSVDFVLFRQKSTHIPDALEEINSFRRRISHLDNCSIQICTSDDRVLHGLVKKWLQDLKDDTDEALQVRLNFKDNLVGSVNHIFCNLYTPINPIVDGFSPCPTCRCHGIPLSDAVRNRMRRLSCPVTNHDLGKCDVIDTSVQVGEETILFLPSFQNSMKLQQITSPIDITVIERTNLRSLSEGLLMGASYVLIPSPGHEIEAASNDACLSDLNTQLFKGLCSALHSLDQGLVCSSKCNIETREETHFPCYYILQPSDNGPLLLRRLAGSEEVLCIPDFQLASSSVYKKVDNSVQASLLKINITEYDPLLHERGFHQKLNSLVKESIQFGSILPKLNELSSERNIIGPPSDMIVNSSSNTDATEMENETSVMGPVVDENKAMACDNSNSTSDCVDTEETALFNPTAQEDKALPRITSNSTPDAIIFDEETSKIKATAEEDNAMANILPKSADDVIIVHEETSIGIPAAQEDRTMACITEEWEQLVVNEAPKMHSPSCISKPMFNQSGFSPESCRLLDRKTSRILERLEDPRQLKPKVVSPTVTSCGKFDACAPNKRELIPSRPIHAKDQVISGTQLMKPNFQRIKRKLK